MTNTTQTIKYTTPSCMVCGQQDFMIVSASGYEAWKSGVLIQDAFPELTRQERELLKTGIHATCWTKMFGDDDE